MSIDSNSQCVKSKYFVCKTAMDESLSDFQETKQNCRGPKTTHKAAKPKARKATKRIKGQKDIRAALKGKKNELITYSKEFDTVCKKSGLDVDSEQLQLAIALSKSLQTQTSDDASTSQSLSTQGRIAKIRTTLQEYGFRVPETKITTSNKRIKKHRKQYKLLNTTEEERHQKISSKFSQVLFSSLDCSILNNYSDQESRDIPVYNIATNLEYECMKDNNIFYVDNLIEKSTTSGSLLRDWSEIPGRPVSPILFETTSTMNFSQIVCSQDELNIILSGPIKSAKDIVATKQTEQKDNHVCNNPKVIIDIEDRENDQYILNQTEKDIDDNNSIIIDDEIPVTKETELKSSSIEVEIMNEASDMINVEPIGTLTVREQYRSCSPDIFDDEVSCIMEVSKPVILSQGQKTKVFTEEINYMDLTECFNDVVSQNIKEIPFTSQNRTRRKSDDCMEITECAVSASQGIRENVTDIDLTQNLDENSLVIKTNKSSSCNLNYVAESPDRSINDYDEVLIVDQLGTKGILKDDIDLTQSSNDDNNFSIIEQNGQVPSETLVSANTIDDNNGVEIEDHLNIENSVQFLKDDIDLTQGSNKDTESIQEYSKINESMDLTQSSKSSVDIDDLPEVKLGLTQKPQSDLDDTIILDKEKYMGADGKLKKYFIVPDIEIFDLTQADYDLTRQPNTKENTSISQGFYEDFVHDHSDSKENIDDNEHCDDNYSVHNQSKDIDLTQSSGESERSSNPKTVFENIPNNSSLGKKHEMSIDYDEVCEYISDKESNCEDGDKDSLNLKYDSSKSQVCNDIEHIDNNNDLVSNSSQNSVVFDLTDKELDYSLHKSRHEVVENYDIDFGGISIMDNVTGVTSFRETFIQQRNNCEDSFLPVVNMKKTEEKYDKADCIVNKPNVCSPAKIDNSGQSSKGAVPAITPRRSQYIIKTGNVTPMLDYESMATPERNRELDKYGLKHFKRKRAVKILTHIYNQTHPVIQPYSDDDQPSPSKRPRLDTNQPLHTSPRKIQKSPRKDQEIIKNKTSDAIRNTKSPRKASEVYRNVVSPRKEGNSSKENIIYDYEVSSGVPNIRGVDCHPEDWVFQKREKAKVHSCRVPLHIAFHNYVSSRQGLREAILKYEPVNIDVIHKDLVSYGHRYDPKDLLRYLDKKCITVKTMDNTARNRR